MGKIGLNLKWEVEIKNKNGKTLFKKSGKSRSLLKNFMLWFHSFFTINIATEYGNQFTVADTLNVARTFPYGSASPKGTFGTFSAAVNIASHGLRVGNGDAAVNPNDYEMETLIEHGAGAGQLVYNAQSVEAVSVVGQVTSFRTTRAFTNNSGGTVTVKEIGAAWLGKDTANIDRYVCYLRDVLPSSVAIPDGSTFTLRYTFSVTA